MKIFISYSRTDVSFIQQLAAELETRKVSAWLDINSIPGGTQWERAIAQGISQSEIVIVCLTAEAINSEWVQKEVFLASSLGKRIIPIMIKPCFDKLISNQNLERLLDLQIIIFEGRYEAAFNKLLNSILEREEISAVDNIYQKSDSADFRSAIESIIFDAKSIVLVGIGLNIMGQEPFAIQLMQKAAEGECRLEIYLANPYDPACRPESHRNNCFSTLSRVEWLETAHEF